MRPDRTAPTRSRWSGQGAGSSMTAPRPVPHRTARQTEPAVSSVEGHEGYSLSRVAVMSWLMPTVSSCRFASLNPARGASRLGFLPDRGGTRLILEGTGRRVAQQSADEWYDLAEIHAMAVSREGVWWLSDLKERDSAARSHDWRRQRMVRARRFLTRNRRYSVY